jgi:hypothetical protein
MFIGIDSSWPRLVFWYEFRKAFEIAEGLFT